MKYVTFAIMAVLIFGVAAAPVFSNGVAFAQTEKQTTIEKKQTSIEKKDSAQEKKEYVQEKKQNSIEKKQSAQEKKDSANEKKQTSIEKKSYANEKKQTSIEKKSYANEKKQTATEKGESIKEKKKFSQVKQQKTQLKEKFEKMSEENKQSLQDKLDAMKEKYIEQHQVKLPVILQLPTHYTEIGDEEKQAILQEIKDRRSAEREVRINMSADEKQELKEQRMAAIKEKRENYVSPRDQYGLGLAPENIICADDKELVVKVTNDMPMCLGPDAVFILMDRGIIAYPE